MEVRQLGRSGIAVSSMGLGVMTFGGQTPEDDAFRQLDMAHGAGITLFDTAENYPTPIQPETQGRSEEVLGRWIAERRLRNRVVIATKVAGPGDAAGDLRHIRGEHRRLDLPNITAALDASLRRLRTDHVDLYQLHWPERAVTTNGRSRFSHVPDARSTVPIAETLDALARMAAAGKVRAIGICNESAWGAMRHVASAEAGGGPRIASIQNGYNLLDRTFELGLAEVAMREDVGLLCYSPLAGGVLTGKYGATPAPLPGSRSSQSPAFLKRLTDNRLRAIAAYCGIARAHGLDPAHMALAFARRQPFTASVLMAARTAEQLSHNLAACDLTLDDAVVRAINAVHDGCPNPR